MRGCPNGIQILKAGAGVEAVFNGVGNALEDPASITPHLVDTMFFEFLQGLRLPARARISPGVADVHPSRVNNMRRLDKAPLLQLLNYGITISGDFLFAGLLPANKGPLHIDADPFVVGPGGRWQE